MGIADRWIILFNKPIPNVILRLVVLFGGFLSMAMSIALMRTTGLGNSPISCIPATLSYLVPLSLGTITFIMNTCFLIVQAILLRRDFNPVQLLQIPFTFVFALMIDQLLPFCETLPMQYYPEQLGWNILGCFLLAMGVFLQVKASFITLPGEGIVLAIAKARLHSTAPWLWFPWSYPSWVWGISRAFAKAPSSPPLPQGPLLPLSANCSPISTASALLKATLVSSLTYP